MKIPSVIFEDETLLVLDKPSGMTVNRSQTTRGGTVQDWIEEKLKTQPFGFAQGESSKLKAEEESDFYKRSGIVHRLDKETSGILLVAKNPEAFVNMQRQFKERGVEKTYLALVHGEVKPQEGEIRVPVGRLPWNRKRFGVIAGGREAVTKYKVIRYYSCHPELVSGSRDSDIRQNDKGDVTLLELYPETGRTHQIRVHLKYFGHPVFSDELYAGRKTARNDRKLLPRLFLHASKVSFTHPRTGERLTLQSPLPSELDQFLRSLGVNRNSPGR